VGAGTKKRSAVGGSTDIQWQLYPAQPELSAKIADYFGCHPLTSQLMLNRSIKTSDDARHFLNQTWLDWPLLPNQHELMAAIQTLIDNQAFVCVYGDYDVDGVTSTAILVDMLRSVGCTVDYIAPHRFNDGYGLNSKRMPSIAHKNYDALITIDCGISNAAEIQELLSMHPNVTVLIIDHHKCPAQLPNATAIVNPQLAEEHHPARHLCSAALLDYLFRTTPIKGIDPDNYSDLTAIALIADVMPLVGLNRHYVAKGLNAIQTHPRQAILELCINAKINHAGITSHDIAFGIGPRLNAPGRLGDPQPVVNMLLNKNSTEIQVQANAIEQLNLKRRSIGEKIQYDIDAQLASDPQVHNGIVCSGQFWHMGVIGINASRLVNQYHKPAIVIGFDTDTARGSARSVPGVNIYNIIRECSAFLTHFGGHSQAAGFSLKPENIVAFKQTFLDKCNGISLTQIQQKMVIDAEILFSTITLAFITELSKLEPHGEANPKPLFYAKARLIDSKKVGKTQAHLKCRFEQNGTILDAIGFNLAHVIEHIPGQHVALAFHVSKNEFRGSVTPQLELIDIKPYEH
jgi:single-stranded-DNA-specific exonuclease